MNTYPWSVGQKIYLILKRIADILISLLLLIPSALVILVYAVAIKIEDGGPVFFRQQRLGKNGKVFTMLKLRSMKQNAEHTGSGVYSGANDPRVLKVGNFARKTSIDELPQIINVLRGEMSFVGPRPLIPEEKEIRVLRQKYNVYSVKPGLTGLAQVYGRDALDDDAKAELDKKYVDEQSLLLDLKILFRTVYVVLKRENVIEGSEKVNTR